MAPRPIPFSDLPPLTRRRLLRARRRQRRRVAGAVSAVVLLVVLVGCRRASRHDASRSTHQAREAVRVGCGVGRRSDDAETRLALVHNARASHCEAPPSARPPSSRPKPHDDPCEQRRSTAPPVPRTSPPSSSAPARPAPLTPSGDRRGRPMGASTLSRPRRRNRPVHREQSARRRADRLVRRRSRPQWSTTRPPMAANG